MIIFDGLKEWLKENDVSLRDFSKKIGVTYASLLSVLRRESNFRLDIVDKLCEVTGLSIGQLITWYPDDTYDMAKAYKKNSVSYEKLFALMKEKGYSDYALSKAIGKCVDYIGKVRRAGNKVSIDSIKQIADLFQVKPTDLFEIIENPESIER